MLNKWAMSCDKSKTGAPSDPPTKSKPYSKPFKKQITLDMKLNVFAVDDGGEVKIKIDKIHEELNVGPLKRSHEMENLNREQPNEPDTKTNLKRTEEVENLHDTTSRHLIAVQEARLGSGSYQ